MDEKTMKKNYYDKVCVVIAKELQWIRHKA